MKAIALAVCIVAALSGVAEERQNPAGPEKVRDILWVWGNPEMAKEGTHTTATFAEAGPAERAALLGVPNIVMAGNGLPDSDQQAEELTKQVAGVPRLVWEIAPDGEGAFTYEKAVARVGGLVQRYPQIEGVLLDDMSTVMIGKGLKPEHLRRLRELLSQKAPQMKLWGAVYTMNLNLPGIDDYIRELDVITLATWHAKDVVDLEKNVAECEKRFPAKPIVLCLYLYDYGEGRRMPLELLERQCATALALVRAGRVKGIIFLTINDDAETVGWAANWVKQVGNEALGAPSGGAAGGGEPLKIGDGSGWRFPAGAWTEDAEGVIRPPDKRNLHSRAFRTATSYGDFEAEFEFNGNYRETGTGSAGLIFRAADPNHFYFLYFPWGGQQLRAKHFWAALAKVDGDGYLRNIKMEWVPGVPSETDRWFKVRVTAQGPQMDVWVDGRRALSVADTSYGNGCMGLAGYGWYSFRNVRVSGAKTPASGWTDAAILSHAIPLSLTSEQMPSGCVAPNGDVLLAADKQLIRSKDKGRTWSVPESLPDKLGVITDYGNSMFCSASGPLMVMLYRTQEAVGKSVPEILIAESPDNGATWSEPAPAQVAPEWPALPKNLVPYGPLVENKDGALMRFLLGNTKQETDAFGDVRTWGATHCKAFVIRSADGGMSWSAPIELDRPAWSGVARGTIPGSLDLTEPTAVVVGDAVTCLVRPVYSAMMWQCWSYDGGATWDAAVRATFPGYAQSMTRTASGAILCAHRYPGYAVNISRDGGLNWDAGTVIDYPAWAMGRMLEVEPDVVLCTYMNAERSLPLLAQLISVTPEGLRPIPPK